MEAGGGVDEGGEEGWEDGADGQLRSQLAEQVGQQAVALPAALAVDDGALCGGGHVSAGMHWGSAVLMLAVALGKACGFGVTSRGWEMREVRGSAVQSGCLQAYWSSLVSGMAADGAQAWAQTFPSIIHCMWAASIRLWAAAHRAAQQQQHHGAPRQPEGKTLRVFMSEVMAVPTADTWSSPMRFWMEAGDLHPGTQAGRQAGF